MKTEYIKKNRNKIDKNNIELTKYIVFSQGKYFPQVPKVNGMYPHKIERSYSTMYRYLKSWYYRITQGIKVH